VVKDLDALAWTRWWFPPDEAPSLHSGILDDPAGWMSSQLTNGTRLSDCGDARCLILLGEPGAGKTYELEREADRLAELGVEAHPVDLGVFPDWRELSRRIEEHPIVETWKRGNGELVLILDGFDEAFLPLDRLTEGLTLIFDRMDLTRLRLRLVGRTSSWPKRFTDWLQAAWPAEAVTTLILAPLTANDISLAADAQLGSAHNFLDMVRTRDVGPMAARPVTLKMLLGLAAQNEDLPHDRADLYSQGVEVLADEWNPRLAEKREVGRSLAQRVAAAQQLAAISVLCGRPTIALQRAITPTPPNVVILEEALGHEIEMDDLRAVWSSSLVTSAGHGLTWTHRSIADYLCAARLAKIPARTALHLLAHPDTPGRVTPQLGGVAVWLAAFKDEILEWIVTSQPELLLGADLPSRSPRQRRSIARALIERLRDGQTAGEYRNYGNLDYPELAGDLRPLITDPAFDPALRSEAIQMVADNKLRDFDTDLVHLIETVAANKQPDDYDPEIRMATWAFIALRDMNDPALLSRLEAIAFDLGAPEHLRAEALSVVWESSGTTATLPQLDADLLGHDSYLSNHVADELRAAGINGAADPALVVGWLDGHPPPAKSNHPFGRAAGPAVLRCAASLPDDSPLWATLGQLSAAQSRNHSSRLFGWKPHDVEVLSDQARRRLALETLRAANNGQPSDVFAVRSAGLLPSKDMPWWFHRYADELGTASQTETAALNVLTLSAPDAANCAAAAAAVAERPNLQQVVEEFFGPERLHTYEQLNAADPENDAKRERERLEQAFSLDHLAAHLAARNWSATRQELERPTGEDVTSRRSYAHDISLSARTPWTKLSPKQRDAVIALAAESLNTRPAGPDAREVDDFCAAWTLLDVERPGTVDNVAEASVLAWLPHILKAPGQYRAPSSMLDELAGTDSAAEAERIVIDQLAIEATNPHVTVTDRLGRYSTTKLIEALLAHARRPETAHDALRAVLDAASERAAERAADVAVEIVAELPAKRPELPQGEAVKTHESPCRKWSRAVAAGVTLATSPVLADHFDELMAAFDTNIEYAEEVVRHARSRQDRRSRPSHQARPPGYTSGPLRHCRNRRRWRPERFTRSTLSKSSAAT
jgi:hypothetical protein